MSPPSNVVRLPSVAPLTWDDCRLLVESVIDYAVFMLDPDGRVATWNRGAEKIKGYAASEVVGEHFSIFFTPEDIAAGKPERELKAASEAGRAEDEGWRVRKDGSRFWANVVITALRDETGKLRGFGKLTRDLTARRATEQAVRQAEQRFHHLVDAVTDYAIFLLDSEGRVSTWNTGARRLKGYAAEEIVGKHFSVFYTPEHRATGRPDRILAAVRSQGRFEDEGWRVRKDGVRFWANVVITALRDEHGELVGFAKVTRDLTDRMRAEEELRRSEERFRLLVDHMGDYAIYMLDPGGHVTTWNRGAERMKGYTADEIVGSSFARFFPTEDVEAGKPAKELEIARAHGRFEDEGWRVRKDGTRLWANAVLTALHDSHGKHIGFAKITRDLTTRRANEETERRLIREQAAREAAEAAKRRFRDSEQRYRSLSRRLEVILEGVSDGITVQDRSGKIVFANSAAARLCGFDTVEQLLNAPPAEIVARFEVMDEEGQPIDFARLPGRRVLAGEPFASIVLHVRERASGRDWWSLVRASAVADEDGTPELAVNIWHDVTDGRRKERLAKHLASATAALSVSLDVTEMFTTLADALVPGLADWCSVYLFSGDTLRGVAVAHADPNRLAHARDYQKRFPPDPAQPRGVWNVVKTGQSEVYNDITDDMLVAAAQTPEHLEILRGAGMRAVLLAPIRDRSGVRGVISLVSAESGRRFDELSVELAHELGRRAGIAIENAHLYRSAQDAARTAEQASRAKDEFLATVSHELRTPLNAIVGWASLLKGRVSDPTIAKPIEVIHRNAHAQVKIIDDILDVSRVITGKFKLEPKPTDLVAVAREAIEAVRPAAVAKKITIDLVSESDFCLLVADPERLQQVVWNLLSNAVKFTDPGGTIWVKTRLEGSNLALSVTDNGRGIEPAFLPHVFERFQQADSSITRRVGGLGLGLALVRHIVELHGGKVHAFSEGLQKGATFTLTLPVRAVIPRSPEESPPAPRVTEGRPTVPAVLTGIRVLVVDDEPDARELLAAVLVERGAEVETARSAAEGFATYQRYRPDVLVSDIGMPDEDGFSFVRRIRELPAREGGAVPALALTAFAREEDRTMAISAGYTTHIGKPVDPEALASAVLNLASVSRPPRP